MSLDSSVSVQPAEFWKRAWARFKKHWKLHLKTTTIVFVIVFAVLITLDQVSKSVVFNGDKSGATGEIQADWGFVAFRSQFHTSTTFLDFIGSSLPRAASLTINYVLIAIFCSLLVFSSSWFSALAISVALTGVIGNTLDATYWFGVRNVLYTGWVNGGVYNFADTYIIIGIPLIAIAYFTDYIIARKKEKAAQKISSADLDLKMTNEAPLIPKAVTIEAPATPLAALKPDPLPEIVAPEAITIAKKPAAKRQITARQAQKNGLKKPVKRPSKQAKTPK